LGRFSGRGKRGDVHLKGKSGRNKEGVNPVNGVKSRVKKPRRPANRHHSSSQEEREGKGVTIWGKGGLDKGRGATPGRPDGATHSPERIARS